MKEYIAIVRFAADGILSAVNANGEILDAVEGLYIPGVTFGDTLLVDREASADERERDEALYAQAGEFLRAGENDSPLPEGFPEV